MKSSKILKDLIDVRQYNATYVYNPASVIVLELLTLTFTEGNSTDIYIHT